MYLPLKPRNSENDTGKEFDETEIRKICQETNSCSLFTYAEILGLTFGGLGLVLDFLTAVFPAALVKSQSLL